MPASYLSTLTGIPGITADFIGRIPGVPVDTDKWATLERLRPCHDERIKAWGFTPGDIWLAEQVHGADVALVTEEQTPSPHMIMGVDGLISPGTTDCLLGIYVADCAAIWLYDTVTGAIGLLHSGKKGTEGNIAGRALEKMDFHFGTSPSHVLAVISPCIRPPLYEIDIASQIVLQLGEAGVPSSQIMDSGLCTGSDLDSFYSYRVEKGRTGRMLALLGKKTMERGL